jgi:hypothetical protein
MWVWVWVWGGTENVSQHRERQEGGCVGGGGEKGGGGRCTKKMKVSTGSGRRVRREEDNERAGR